MIPPELVESRKKELKKLRETVNEKMGGGDAMKFYDTLISEERKKELKDIVSSKRRLVPQSEL